jgi:hypothetical protein
MSALLVITTGQTDVQLVEGDGRRELSRRNCASLHDEIERRAGKWRLVDSPPKAAGAVESLPQGAFHLCAPKLDAVLQYAKDKRITLTSALILETRRDAQAAPGDPRYAGAILATRLREYRITDVRQVPFLTDQERLEGCEPRDAVIRHEVVDRIDGAVGKAIEDFSPAQILVATTGGFPVVANLVEEIVRLYAAPDGKVELLEVPDGADGHAVSRERVPEPAASYQARRHALDLIEKGNLLGAWGAVQHLHDDAVEQRWTRVVEWLSQFAASLPIDSGCDIDLLTQSSMAARAALRVEMALRARDIPRAVHGTVAFFESAFWDWLGKHDFSAEGITQLNNTDFQLPAPHLSNQSKRFRRNRNNTNWRVNDFESGIEAWLPIIGKPSLCAFWNALTDDIRNLRNDVAHNEPTSELMSEAHAKMVAASLWYQNHEFLATPLVQCVLRDLGEQHPDRLCTDLVSTVRSRLRRVRRLAGEQGLEPAGGARSWNLPEETN